MLVLIGISWYHHRKKRKGIEDFLIADRKLKIWAASLSMMASFVGGGTIMGSSALVFQYGIYIIPFIFSLPLGLLLLSFFAPMINKKAKEEKWFTYYDFFSKKFGNSIKYLIAIINVVCMFLILAVAMITGAILIGLVSGYSQFVSVLIMAVIVVSYLMIAGFSSVVKTDIIQGIMILILMGGLALFSSYYPSEIKDYASIGFETINPLLLLVMFTLGIIYVFSDEPCFQRIYAIGENKNVKKSMKFTFTIFTLFYIFLVFAAIKLKSIFPALSGDEAFLSGMLRVVPDSCHFLIVLAVLSIVLSSIDTYTFNLALNINKLYMDIKHKAINHELLVRRIKITIPIILLSLIFISIMIKSIVSTVFFYGVLMATNSFIVIGGLLFKKFDKNYAMAILITNLILVCLFVIFMGSSPKMAIVPFISTILGIIIVFIKRIVCRYICIKSIKKAFRRQKA